MKKCDECNTPTKEDILVPIVKAGTHHISKVCPTCAEKLKAQNLSNMIPDGSIDIC